MPSAKAPPAAVVTPAAIGRGLRDIPFAEKIQHALASITASPWARLAQPDAMFLDYFAILLGDYIERTLGEPTVDKIEISEVASMVKLELVDRSILKSFALWQRFGD